MSSPIHKIIAPVDFSDASQVRVHRPVPSLAFEETAAQICSA